MSSKQKKILGITTAVILVLALGLAGTFAASGSAESDGNISETVDTSIVLHDDFSLDWTGDVRDRDVYVENTGDSSLYVRVRLDEFMKYGNKILAGTGGTKDDTSKWKPHIPMGTDVTACDTEVHDYFTIQMGNETGIKYKPGIVNAYKEGIADADKTKTTSAAEVVLIEDYLKAKDKPDPCWIVDKEDGYAYWYTQLKKDSATGLILNSITNTNMVDESYYYGINAKAEAVTEMDLNAWFWGQAPKDSVTGEAFDQASTNAIRLLKNMSPKYTEITAEMEANGAKDFDSDNDGYLTKQENIEYEAAKGVTPTPELTLKEKVKQANVGTTITIPNADSTYGASTDWLVIMKDSTTGEAVLLTKNMVTTKKFHNAMPYPTWPSSDIRYWLNGEGSFAGSGYIDTLSQEMKAAIKKENLKTAKAYNDWSEGNMTASTDSVYLLTETQDGGSQIGKNPGSATNISANYLQCSKTTADGKTADYWWLRSPRASTTNPDGRSGSISCSTGEFNSAGIAVFYEFGVRPTVTINFN